MAFGLLITRNDIIKNTPLGGAIDADSLLPFIRTAQEKYILNLVGTVLYDKLQDDVESQTAFTGYYLTLVEDYIKPTLIWYSCVEYIPFSATSFKSEGAVKHKSEQSEPVPKIEIDYLAAKAQDNAEYYATRMQDYLIANGTNIPEFFETTGDTTNIFPDQSNQYFGGLNL
jgi:hypothetical protein|tara:strand:+ start:618 stop:1130 length:513 start_codon:yes stop_codon:yes gene_type:complete